MYSGTNIVLVTNNESMIGLLSSELVQLRNIDSILIRNYQDTISTIETEKPQAIILNCQNTMEEPFCLDLIKKIKEVSSIPIILLVETYNSQFIRIANKLGISDVISIQYGNSEILMRTIWSLQKSELKQQHKKYEKLLCQLNAIDENTGFYTVKHSDKVFQNEIEYLNSKGIDGIFMAIEPNKNSRLRPSRDNLVDTIKNNTRATDTIAHTKSSETFYILLSNTNLEGAMIVWNRINNNIGASEALCGCIFDLGKNLSYDEISYELKEGITKSHDAPNYLYIIDENQKKNDNWLEETSIPVNNSSKNFKIFRQIYNRKIEKIIKPTVEELLKEYEDVLGSTETPIVETDSTFAVKFLNKRQESEFKIIQDANYIKIEANHSGLDSPENKNYTLDLNEISIKEIQNLFEDFIVEFQSCFR